MAGFGQTVLLSAILLIAMMAISSAGSVSITATLIKPSTTSTTTSSTTTIMPAPSVSVSPGSQSINVGQPFTIASNTLSIGAGGLSYQWFNDTSGTPNAIAGANMPDYNSMGGATGTFTYYLAINDIMDNNAISNNALVTVAAPAITPSLSGTGGGGGGGGTFRPTVLPYSNGNQTGWEIINLTNFETQSVTINGKTFTTVVNFVTPTSSGVTLNGNGYAFQLGSIYELNNSAGHTYYAEITSITFLDIVGADVMTLLIWEQPNGPFIIPPQQTANTITSTTTVPTTTVPSTTVPPTTTVPQNSAGNSFLPLMGSGIAIAVAIAIGVAYSRGNRRRR